MRLNQKSPKEVFETTVRKNVNGCINNASMVYGKNIYVYFVDLDGKLNEVSYPVQGNKESGKRLID